MELSLDVTKIIVLATLLIGTFLFGVIPVIFIKYINKRTPYDDVSPSNSLRLQRNENSLHKKLLSFLSCFSAGVFLATCFLDILPDVRRSIVQSLFSEKIYTEFPVSEFVSIFGLFFILIVEQIVLTVKESHGETENHESAPLITEELHNHQEELYYSYQSDHSLEGLCDQPHIEYGQREPQQNEETHRQSQNSGVMFSDSNRGNSNFTGSIQNVNENRNDQPHSRASHAPKTHSPLRAMLLLIALAFHSIFEGLTVGMQTSKREVLSIFGALALHKMILSFSLGMNLVQSRISIKTTLKSLIVFSFASPVGIGIGIAISDLWTSVTSGLIHGLLQGIASGTFLYVIFFEILPKEFNNEFNRILKVLFLIVGYGCVAGILFLTNDDKKPFCVINDKSKP